ncbi:unnamed protein product, partial [Discosporangium mesarthrocarpum]
MIESLDSCLEFLRGWHPAEAQLGMTPSDLPSNVPAPLKDVYRVFGQTLESRGPGPFSAQDSLVPPSRLQWKSEECDVCWENQGVWRAFIRTQEHDPEVFVDGPTGRAGRSEIRSLGVSLSSFLVALGLQEAALSSRWLATITSMPWPKLLSHPPSVLATNLQYAWQEERLSFYTCTRDFLIYE